MTNPEIDGVLAAHALMSKAALSGDDITPLMADVDKIASGDAVRETLVSLASIAGGVVRLVASGRGETVERLLDTLAGFTVDAINEAGDHIGEEV